MDCEKFLTNYSDFLDRRFEAHHRSSYCSHLLECPSCAEYDRVMRRGLSLVRQLDPPESGTDFGRGFYGPMLPAGERDIYPATQRSPSTAATGLAVGGLIALTLLIALGSRRQPVELPPVVVDNATEVRDRPSLWGPSPRFAPAANLLQVPQLRSDPVLATPTEPLSLFREPFSTATPEVDAIRREAE